MGARRPTALREAAEASGLELVPDPGGAAFYGPKISVQARDAIGRTWQMSTIQLDFNQPDAVRAGVHRPPTAPRQRPVMIHRALFGSIERFFGVLTEHYAGAFPAWLAPVQVVGIPVTDEQVPLPARRRRAAARARASGSRSTTPTTGCRRRSAPRSKQKVPFMLHRRRDGRRGGRGVASATATARQRNGVPVDEAVDADRRLDRAARHNADPTAESGRRALRGAEVRPQVTGPGCGSDGGGHAGRLRAAVDAAPDGLHPGRGQADRRADDCPFCRIPTLADEDGLIVARGERCTPCSTCTRTTPAT